MSTLRYIQPLLSDDICIFANGDTVRFEGVISMRNPSETITPFLKSVHQAIVDAGLSRVHVDITELSFMNSSSIRSLVDWVTWIGREPSSRQYVLAFRASPEITWQETTLSAMRALDEMHVEVAES